MPTSVVVPLMQAIKAAADTQFADDEVSVYFGMPVTDDPGFYFMVGVANPEDDGSIETASAQQSWASIGARSRDESGEIDCAICTWNGEGDVEQGMLDAQALIEQVEQMCRTNPSFDVAQVLWTGYGANTQWTHTQYDKGVVVLAFFGIGFRARL